MSNFLAIATVTETFRQILDAAAAASKISGAIATALRPITGSAGLPQVGVNLYLYQVTPNAVLRNTDLPSRRGDGTIMEAPQIALDLHYLLTFYGKEHDLEPQRVMGSVLRTLNSRPLLTRKSIQNAKLSVSVLAASNLDDQVELVRFRMIPMTLEELSKLWSVFLQTPYVLSAIYQASVVLIQGDEVAQPALPVRKRKLYVETFRQPQIEVVLSQKGSAEPLADQPIVLGDTLVLVGKQLLGGTTRVRLGGIEVGLTDASEMQIKVPLSAPPFPADTLRAGVHGVQVVQWTMMGEPPEPHTGVDSNVAPFVLHPTITATAAPVSSRMAGGVRLCTNNVSLNVSPKVGVGQRVVLLLNEFNPPSTRRARSYRFDVEVIAAHPADKSVNPLTTQVKDVAVGKYLVRIQVDGAESPLDLETDPNNPRFATPRVNIT
jgi:hypothetical protein